MPDRQDASMRDDIRPHLIPEYRMPDSSVLGLNRVDWHFDPGAAILLIHDMQNYWIEPFEQPDVMVNNIRLLRQQAGQQGIPVVFTGMKVARNDAERGLAYDMFGPGIGRTSDAKPRDHEIIAALAPSDGEHLLLKTKYSAFFQTDLEQMLGAWQRQQIILCGVFAHHGCMITAVDGYMRDYQVFFVADALGDHSQESHHMALEYVARVCGQIVFASKFFGSASEPGR
jgi:isochorismate hydrolase